MKMNRNDLIIINDLVNLENENTGIDKYVLEFNKKEKALFIERFDFKGIYVICLRKEMENITKDELIPITNSIYFGNMLKTIEDNEIVELLVKDNRVIIRAKEGDIKLQYFEEDNEELESKENVKNAFKTRKYGDKDNMLTFYERENKEDPNPDAKCKINIDKLNDRTFLNLEGTKEIGAFKDTFYIRNGNYRDIIKKENDKDLMNIIGECAILIDNIDCLLFLGRYSGFVNIHIKDDFPLVIIKNIPKHKIGVNYIISIKGWCK